MIFSARAKSRETSKSAMVLDARPTPPLQADVTAAVPALASETQSELAERILSRIESRLPGRIRHLTVYITDNAVVLTGECSTFYTKQLAQHAAMGVLEYERLINNIDVRVAK